MAAISLAMPGDSFGKCGKKALFYSQILTCSLEADNLLNLTSDPLSGTGSLRVVRSGVS